MENEIFKNQLVLRREKTSYRFRFRREFDKILNLIQSRLLPNKKVFVDVLLTSQENIQKIGNEFGKSKNQIDVLSFPLFSFEEVKQSIFEPVNIGQIVFSVEEIRKNAKKFGHSIKREFTYLFAHSLLHLLDFDHKTKEEENFMNQICEDSLEELNIKRIKTQNYE